MFTVLSILAFLKWLEEYRKNGVATRNCRLAYARTDAKLKMKRKAIEATSKKMLPTEDVTRDTDTDLTEWHNIPGNAAL